ncbi:hypothetical protein OIN60_12110 [Paenibacillus sp. P96]|uniref:Uncharacterized protein n=1 Tax=Paenibacillus zeirhizosphaerae TaxID=2987519 RepID=A0ABT9FS23_9BACL|nr:hypothetical protein [Paenibacillus sp. P96]MDP4097515.1 hypothetical protein [Paenibacillus sp. P96]
MSLKAIELQIAVPRTSEAGKVQSENRHRMVNDQALLGEQAVKATETIRQRSEAVDESADAVVRDQKGQSNHEDDRNKRRGSEPTQDNQPAVHQAEHPFKGHYIDLSL